jgi:hypothetical protein
MTDNDIITWLLEVMERMDQLSHGCHAEPEKYREAVRWLKAMLNAQQSPQS